MTMSRLAVAALAISVAVTPAVAYEYTTFEQLLVTSAAAPRCQTGALLNLPAAWRAGDGAVVLLMPEPMQDAARDQLVAALLAERAAVLEFVPRACEAVSPGHDTVVAGALGALEAMTRTVGAGAVVAIGYGRGGTAVLDAVRNPMVGLLGANGPRYVAAIAMGDGTPSFALGSLLPVENQLPSRLAALCDALAASAGGMGATPDRIAPTSAAEMCRGAMASQTTLAVTTRR
jgi:hypothetical protein